MAIRLSALPLALVAISPEIMAAADDEHGFVADTSLNILSRNFFLQNDYRTGQRDQSYR